MEQVLKIAFAGQPNSGKSTVFNNITGARQHVANYPGITVEKKTGEYNISGQAVLITDLPGTYSLTSYSPEERVTRDFILYENPELLLNIVDSSNLERHLYLTFQLLEMQAPVVMYANKMDMAEQAGIQLDAKKLSDILGIPVMAGSAKKKENVKELKKLIIDSARAKNTENLYQIKYSDDMENALSEIIGALKQLKKLKEVDIPLRWLAVKLCEKDESVLEDQKANFENIESIMPLVEKLEAEHQEKHKHGFEVEVAIARSTVAKQIVSECTTKTEPSEELIKKTGTKMRIAEVSGFAILGFITYMLLHSILLSLPFSLGEFRIGGTEVATTQIEAVDGANTEADDESGSAEASDAGAEEANTVAAGEEGAELTETEGGFLITGAAVLSILLAIAFVFGGVRIYNKGATSATSHTDRVDRLLCHRVYGLVVLIELISVFYWITVILGYMLTDKVFPFFRFVRASISQLLPVGGLVEEGLIRGLLLSGVIDGAIMILNYVPIFFFLFALVAFLEDVGYMARLAFIMDRILRKFGLHGQSTLPMILSGVIMGGCVVPGVMSTRTIRDERSRLVTILILPLLNCMAKIPFYVLIVGIFFSSKQWLVLSGISIFTLVMALIVAKYFSLYVVPGEAAPFVLELPPYSMPTLKTVLIRTMERLWSFIKKVATTVVAVSVVIWFGITFPRLSTERAEFYNQEKEAEISKFAKKLKNSYTEFFDSEEELSRYQLFEERQSVMESLNWFGGEKRNQEILSRLMLENPEFLKVSLRGKIEFGDQLPAFTIYHENYTKAKETYLELYENAEDAEKPKLKQKFFNYWQALNPYFFAIVRTGTIEIDEDGVVDTEAKKVGKQMRKIYTAMKFLSVDRHKECLHNSALGRAGKFMEPVTKYAGFDWRINVAILGSFAAKEALVSTLGTIYSVETGDEKLLEESIKAGEGGMTALDGLVVMLLIALFPPCIATVIVIRTETRSTGWTLFTLLYPVVLGSLVAVLVFQTGCLLGFK